MTPDILPLEALERLSRQDGVDTRPILVRVLTDLFVQSPGHSREEIDRYEELVSKLLDVVNVDARAAVARKLADEPHAPPRLIERLIDDDVSVSTPILARFPKVPRQTLLTLALDGGPAEAAAVASRSDVDADLIRTLAHHRDDLVVETLVANPAAHPGEATLTAIVERAMTSAAVAAALLRRDDLDMALLAPLYLRAEPPRRRAIRAALEARPARSGALLRAHSADAIHAALNEAVADASRGQAIAEAVGEALGLKPDHASFLATEPSGEAFVLMLRAAGVDSDLVARALLLAQPDTAQSVARFFELVDVAETTPRNVAGELVSALAGQAGRFGGNRHEPHLDPSGSAERSGVARQLRRPLLGLTDRQRA